jgi:DNA cross-link repair 1A protein
VVCGCYTIGKERIFIAIAELLDIKICVTREKMKIIECLDNEKLIKRVTLDPKETFLHVLPIGQLNIKVFISNYFVYESYYL